MKELPPVNYVIQKSKRSRPFIAHVDKLKPWDNDNPPRSWLTNKDLQPGPGNGDYVWRNGDVADDGTTGTFHSNNGHTGDDVGVGTPGVINLGNGEWPGKSIGVVGDMAPAHNKTI